VIPPWVNIDTGEYIHPSAVYQDTECRWFNFMLDAEYRYSQQIKDGWTPQQARSVLPNSTKTEIIVTANFREWRHIFKLRCSKAAHPQMREIMIPLCKKCTKLIPIIFDDIEY
jgi:thymidylate synthase (FAD)